MNRSMRPIILALFTLQVFAFQNCSFVDGFKSSPISEKSKSQNSGGNGDGYTGMRYDKNIYGFSCEGQPAPASTLEISANSATLTVNSADKCASSVTTIALDQIARSTSTEIVVAFKNTIFSKHDLGSSFYVDAWCHRPESTTGALDVVIQKDPNLSSYKALTYLNSSELPQVAVVRDQNVNRIDYSGHQFDLNVDLQAKTLMPAWPMQATLQSMFNGQPMNRALGCITSLNTPETADTWVQIPDTLSGAPPVRGNHLSAWTGTQMFILGGSALIASDGTWRYRHFFDGGLLDLVTTKWTPIPAMQTDGSNIVAYHSKAFWTGSEILVWLPKRYFSPISSDHNITGLFNPISKTWRYSDGSEPSAGFSVMSNAAWADNQMLLWPANEESTRVGGPPGEIWSFDPLSAHWKIMPSINAPKPTVSSFTVWTGKELIVWGGFDHDANNYKSFHNSGAMYNPKTGIWRPMSVIGAPSARAGKAAVWTGEEMIIWGGAGDYGYQVNGGIFNPKTNSWRPISEKNAPKQVAFSDGMGAKAFWTGRKMILWGNISHSDGQSAIDPNNPGAVYDLYSDQWQAMSKTNSPQSSPFQSIIWDGLNMITWGGQIPVTQSPGVVGGVYLPPSISGK